VPYSAWIPLSVARGCLSEYRIINVGSICAKDAKGLERRESGSLDQSKGRGMREVAITLPDKLPRKAMRQGTCVSCSKMMGGYNYCDGSAVVRKLSRSHLHKCEAAPGLRAKARAGRTSVPIPHPKLRT